MEGVAELAFGIAALVYAAGLAIFRLPLPQVRRWGWTLMMHSWSGIAVVSAVGSIAVIKSLLANYLPGLGLNLPLAATFDDAIASATAARDMAYSWLTTISFAALALGALQSILMLAMTVLYITGAGILIATIASYLFGAVFSLLIFIAKVLSGVVLFMEGVVAFVGMSKFVAPAIFTIGLALFMIPFARTAGKTMIVLGAALTLALPVAIVAASPPPGYAERSIAESAELQALSIASRGIADLTGGARYTIYDRENDTLYYPFLEAEPLALPEIDRSKACSNLPKTGNVTCEQVVAIMEDILRSTPERAIFDTEGGGYYDAYSEGYRLTFVNNTYARKIWFLNMWVTLHDRAPKDITVYRIPERPDQDVVDCVTAPAGGTGYYGGGYADAMCRQPYLFWKYKWQVFWWSTNLYNETSQWMVAANRKTTFVWFTEQPWGTPKQDLNIYGITLPKVRETRWTEEETYECETDGNSTTVETCSRTIYYTRGDYSGNKSVYFVYLNMPDQQVCGTGPIGPGGAGNETICHTVPGTPSWSYRFVPSQSNPPTWSHTVRDSSFAEIKSAGFIDGYGPYTLRQSVEAVDRNEDLTLNAPTEEKKVFVTANQTIVRSSYEGYPDVPERLDYSFRVVFTASESAPYLPQVLWEKFDEDERYFRELASGSYVPDSIAGVAVDTMRQDWAKYPNFRQGLYRDSPSHEATRRINAKFLEYRDESWEENQKIFNTDIPLAQSITNILYENAYGAYAGSNIQIPVMGLMLTPSGAVGVLKPLSELLGQSFAIGLSIALLALVIDSFNALVGGQSVMMKYMLTKVGGISQGLRFFSGFMSAVHRMSRINMPAQIIARRQQDQMLKAAFEQWKHDRRKWEDLRLKRMESMNRVRDRITLARQRYAVRSWFADRAFERLAELEGQPGLSAAAQRLFLREVARKQVLSDISYGLHRRGFAEDFRGTYASTLTARGLDQRTAERKADDIIRGVKQRTPARMRPEEFAEGAASMLRSASPLERIALADSLVRPGSNVGRTVFFSTLLDREMRAPAAFSLAYQASRDSIPGTQFTGEGVKFTIPPAYLPSLRTGIITRGTESAETPVIRDPLLGGKVGDVARLGELVERYGSPSDIKRFDTNLASYMEATIPYDQSVRLSDFLDNTGRQGTEDKVAVTVERTFKEFEGINLSQPEKFQTEYEVPASRLEEFIHRVEAEGGRILSAETIRAEAVDAQGYPPDPFSRTDIPNTEKSVTVTDSGKDMFTAEFEVPADKISEFKEIAGGRITAAEKPTLPHEDGQTYIEAGSSWWSGPDWINEQGGKTAGDPDSQANEGWRASSWWSGPEWGESKAGGLSDVSEDQKTGDFGGTDLWTTGSEGEAEKAGGWLSKSDAGRRTVGGGGNE